MDLLYTSMALMGQWEAHSPQPVQAWGSMYRGLDLTVTSKLPCSPSTDSISLLVRKSMFMCRPTSTSTGEMIHMAQSLVGKVLSSQDIIPPMYGDCSTK